MLYVGNSFSLGAVIWEQYHITVHDLSAEEAAELLRQLDWTSCVGHADTAAILTRILGTEIPYNRISVQIRDEWDDEYLVAQYNGPRLPEGATSLPEGAEFKFKLLTFDPM